MNNQEIRFRILYYLYQKHFSKDLGKPQVVETIIKELGLDDEGIDRSVIYGNVVYLNKSGLIEGMIQMEKVIHHMSLSQILE